MLALGAHRSEIETPALLVDLDVMERNIAVMSEFFRHRPAKLRPHFKSPKSPAIAKRLLAAGAIGMTCAKVGEAEVLVRHGVSDILIANQVIGADKLARVVALARQADMAAMEAAFWSAERVTLAGVDDPLLEQVAVLALERRRSRDRA